MSQNPNESRKTVSHCGKLLLLLVLVVSGCAAPRLNTKSGLPETVIKADAKTVRTALIERLINKGYIISNETEAMIQFEGNATNAADFWFTNTLSGERPKIILRCNILTADGTRLLVAPKLYRPSHRAEIDLGSKDFNRIQQFLDCLAADLENRPHTHYSQ